MTRICVVGGGTAGSEAAHEAEARGAMVTVVEKLAKPDPPWESWIGRAGRSKSGLAIRVDVRSGLGNLTVLSKEAKSVGAGFVRTTDGGTIDAEQVILAVGSTFEEVSFPGRRKPGVLVLNCVGKYAEMSRLEGQAERVVICGEGYRALEVAETLLEGCDSVHLCISSWQTERPSPPVMSALERAARVRGASFRNGALLRAVGSAMAEAVVVGGEVIPCDALLVVPRRLPLTVPSAAPLGPKGGYLVDSNLKTCPAVHAAGGCAELQTDFTLTRTLEDEPAMTGRIAGANCIGERLQVGPFRSSRAHLFGLVWARVGLGPLAARAAGLDFDTANCKRDAFSACNIVYLRHNGEVVGVEWIDATGPATSEIIPISSGLNLKTLAYWTPGSSSDISLVSDTARLGLGQWRRS